ncbi:MAG: DUF2202 domain-containing protein [Gammaproteobacteria bacterium]|nr:DUF2202 domain-containing protein [Gammaproteobacteria bacterium]
MIPLHSCFRRRASCWASTVVLATALIAPGALVAAVLSTEAIQTLTFMREEEKLARDVYLTLNEAWGQSVFANIARSEQQHMDAMLAMLNRYGLPDPATTVMGVFNNSDLQALYTELVNRGQQSAVEALSVGAAIEEIDILDLQQALADEQLPADLRQSYENLLAASGNHLRAFVRNIENQGLVYEAQFMGSEQLAAILDAPTWRPKSNERGQNGRGRISKR